MHILSGLFPHMVMQRDRQDRSDQRLTGRAVARCAISVRVSAAGKALSGFARKPLGKADSKGRFSLRLKGIPVGGPYDIVVTAGEEALSCHDVLVGDVWVLAGQSNMEGIGNLSQAGKPHPLVRNFYMDERWATASDPLHNLADAKARCHRIISPQIGRSAYKGVGPGLSFAKELAEKHGVPQGLIPSAHGGTSMAQWKPGKGDRCLFGAMVDRVEKNGGRVAGVCWYQGESDANASDLQVYGKRMEQLVGAMRKHFGAVPVAVVQIASVCSLGWCNPDSWNGMREAQRRLPERISRLATVPAIDLALDDLIHIGGAGQQVLGRRLAGAIDALRYGKKAAPPPIALKSIKRCREKGTGADLIEVRFDNVVGGLQAPGKPHGFSLTVGSDCGEHIYRCDLRGDRVILHHILSPADLDDASLYYGYGLMPYCNIVDDAGRSLPALGPVPLGKGYPKTAFGAGLMTSKLVQAEGPISKLAHPGDKMRFSPCPNQSFYNPVQALRASKDERLVFYRQRIHCRERMQLDLLLGYDGPVKIWFDGKDIFCDAKGTNPILPDEQCIPLKAGKGDHELVIALSSAAGKALGIALRYGRRDLPANCPAEKRILPEAIT